MVMMKAIKIHDLSISDFYYSWMNSYEVMKNSDRVIFHLTYLLK